MSMARYTFEYSNNLSELERMTDHIDRIGRELGLSQRDLFQIKFAVEEVFVNIVSYGYDDNINHTIKLEVRSENGILYLCIKDDGRPFNPLKAGTPDTTCPIEERQIGGLGLHLTRKMVKDVAYERREGLNVLTIEAEVGT